MKTILVDAFNTFVFPEKGMFKEMHELLETYQNPKIILTNANDEQLVQFGIVDMPYEVFTLKHNPDKVDPQYFEKMLAHFGLTAADVIYFEHNPEAVASAQSVGITSYHYDHDKRDLAALKAFIDANV
jgi:HAD superfamily hydrolase (TIGR01509 family)